jgi:hypothetical protein
MELSKPSTSPFKNIQPHTGPSNSADRIESKAAVPVSDRFLPGLADEPSPHLIQPKIGQSYLAHQDMPRPITLNFDPKAVAFFENAGLKLDLEEAQIVTPDGRRVPLDHRVISETEPAQRYAVESGQKLASSAEPWQFRVPGMPGAVFGKPHGIRFLGADTGLSLKFLDHAGAEIDRASALPERGDAQGMRVETRVFRRDRQTTLGRLAAHVPAPSVIGPALLPFTDHNLTNVTFRAPNQKSLDTAKTTFEKLLGSVARDRAVGIDLEKLKTYEQQFQKTLAKKVESGGEVDGFAAMLETLDEPVALNAMQELHGPGAKSLTKESLLDQVGAKALRACPLEIVIIPRDKTATDCVEVERASTKEQLSRAGRAYFLRANPFAYRSETGSEKLPAQRLFIGEEILEQEQGVKAVFMHELLHVFEHLYATPQETQQIDTSYQEAKEFQSLYGSARDEYLTTLGEEFWGTHGSDGPAWVKKYHRPVYDLLAKLTGTDPEP